MTRPKWELEKCIIEGALVSWDQMAPFHRAPLVLRIQEASLLTVSRYLGHEVEGDILSEDEWKSLIQGHQAMELNGAPPPEQGLCLWLLRTELPSNVRDELENHLDREKKIRKEWMGPQKERALLICESGTQWMRSEAAAQCTRLAIKSIEMGIPSEAQKAAEAAFYLVPNMTPEQWALLSFTLKKNGREMRCEGTLKMAENTFGAEFTRAARQEISRLEKSPLAGPVKAGSRHFAPYRRDALGDSLLALGVAA